MSNPFSGIGQGRGSLSTEHLPMPDDTPALVRLFAEELAKPGIYSFHLEEGHPIKVQRYVDPDDLMMNRGVDASPPQIMRNLENLWDFPERESGSDTLIQAMLYVAQYRMTPSAIVVGSLKALEAWLQIDERMAFALKVLDRSCDFALLGLKGYVDDTLPDDRMVLLGGDTPAPTMASIKMGLSIQMEVPYGLLDRPGAHRDRATLPRRGSSGEGQEPTNGKGGVPGVPKP